MKSTAIISALLSIASIVRSQVAYNSTTGDFTCAVANATYCAADSLTSNIIIRCQGTSGYPGNCNDNLAGVDPIGVKTNALCYQSSLSAGDAACSLNGVVYGDNGTYPVPGSGGTTTTTVTSSGSASGSASASGSSTVTSTYTSTGTLTATVPVSTSTRATPSVPISIVTTLTTFSTSAPYPTGANSTAARSTTIVTTTGSTVSSNATASSTFSASPSSFTGAAVTQAVGSGLGGLIAAGALMMLF